MVNKCKKEKSKLQMERNYQDDNLKCFLIFCVVLGHFLELIGFRDLYCLIYTFHMPCFLFLTGCYAKYDRKKMIGNVIYPYFIFQVLYISFQAVVIDNSQEIKIQFTTPYWLLWYMVVILFYYLLLPLIETKKQHTRYRILGGVILLSLFAGFDSTVGYYLSISRFFTFWPYFVLGYYWRERSDNVSNRIQYKATTYIFVLNIMIIVGIGYIIRKTNYISAVMLYGSYSYQAANYNILKKMLLLLVGVNWIVFFKKIIPKRKVWCVSTVGKNTLPIFLVHGFIIKLIGKIGGVFIYSKYKNLGIAVIFTIGILVLCGNNYFARLFQLIGTSKWLEKRKKK